MRLLTVVFFFLVLFWSRANDQVNTSITDEGIEDCLVVNYTENVQSVFAVDDTEEIEYEFDNILSQSTVSSIFKQTILYAYIVSKKKIHFLFFFADLSPPYRA